MNTHKLLFMKKHTKRLLKFNKSRISAIDNLKGKGPDPNVGFSSYALCSIIDCVGPTSVTSYPKTFTC